MAKREVYMSGMKARSSMDAQLETLKGKDGDTSSSTPGNRGDRRRGTSSPS